MPEHHYLATSQTITRRGKGEGEASDNWLSEGGRRVAGGSGLPCFFPLLLRAKCATV